MKKEIKNNLKELGLKENEVKVYIALTKLGEAKVVEISKKAGLPRTTAGSILEKLTEENYFTSHRYRGKTFYWIESPKVITNILQHKTDIAKKLEPQLISFYRKESNFPTAQIFDTKQSIKRFIEKTLNSLPKKSTIYTIDTPQEGNYAKIYSDSTHDNFNQLKKKREIFTKTLIPTNTFKKINPKKITKEIEIREMPKGMSFESSIWIIGKKLVHFSGNPPFLIAISHPKIINSMKATFDFIWNIKKD